MAIHKIKKGTALNIPIQEFCADTREEYEDLIESTEGQDAPVGSKIFIITDSNDESGWYIKATGNTWIKQSISL